MAIQPAGYAARLEIDYPEELDRLTTFFRLIWIIPIGIIQRWPREFGPAVKLEMAYGSLVE